MILYDKNFFEIIMIEDLNFWRGTSTKYNTVMLVSDIQLNICIIDQSYVYTSSIQFKKQFQSSITIDTWLKNLKKIQSPVQVNWVWKNFKIFSKFNSSETWVKKIQSFKV